jgi:pimeloyl-ACP methyl ester carboxylesterase
MVYLPMRDGGVYYETAGNGPPLLLVMGLGGNTQIWGYVRRRLAAEFSLVMYDMRGTGRSPATCQPLTADDLVEEVEALRQHLGIQELRAVGYSFGMSVVLRYANQFPTRLKAVSLVSGMLEIGTYAQRFFETQAELAQILPRTQYLKQVAFWMLSEGFFANNPDYFDRIVFMAERSPLAAQPFQGWERFAPTLKSDYTAELRSLKCPLQIVHGSADKVAPVDAIESVARQLTDVRLDVVPGAGHMMPVDSPEPMAEHLRSFFTSTLAAGK